MSTEPIPLLERDADVDAVLRRLEAARAGEGSIVVVEGPGGVGKSRLLAVARERGRAGGLRVLSARGSRLERDLSFGVAHQLLAPLLDAGEPSGDDLVAAALNPIDTGRLGGADTEPTFAVLHALHRVLVAAARRSPLMLAIDDLPLVDSASLRMLAYTARRLSGLPILLAVAARPAKGGLRSEAVEDVLADPDALVLRPGPLSPAGVAGLLAAGLGAPVDPAFAAASYELTRGLPAQLVRLVRELADNGVEPTAAAAATLAEVAGPSLGGSRREPRPAVPPGGGVDLGGLDEATEASLALARGRELALEGRSAEAARLSQDAVARLEGRHASLAFRLEAELAIVARTSLHIRRRNLQRLRDLARGLSRDDPASRLLVANLALDGALRGEAAASVGTLAEVAWAAGRLLADEGPTAPSVHAVAAVLFVAERDTTCAQVLGATLAEARAREAPAAASLALTMRAELRLRRGSLAEAEQDARAALQTAGGERAGPSAAPAAASLVNVLIARDDLAQAEAVLAAASTPAGAVEPPYADTLLSARGRLRMAQGRPEDALGDLLDCGRRLEARAITNPALIAWRSSAAVALVALGQQERARELALEEVEAARAFGAPTAQAFVLCQAGLAVGGPEGLKLLREAVGLLEGGDAPLPEALALVELGAALRRGGLRVEARDHLRRAQLLAEHTGAARIARRARDELVAAGARPRRVEVSGPRSLTFSERRAAELAAQGWPNRRIAQELYVTAKTVEMHLTNAYRKLGITSRTQLPEALAEEAVLEPVLPAPELGLR
jgi:DNA-binding CsgD family transcriptional regulator